MKSTPRTRKLGESVKEVLAEVLREDVSDPRLEFVTVTGVNVSSDLHVADVYVTTHGDRARYDEMLAGLASADGRIRSGLARRVKLRFTPELRFHVDTSVDESMRIYEALKDVPPGLTDAEG